MSNGNNVKLVTVREIADYGSVMTQTTDFLNRMNLKDTFNNITLTWENVNVFVNEKKGRKKTKKHILQDIDGIAKPGQLMAIMGASGSGKTTLLNVLNYRNRGTLNVSGDIKLNGQTINSALSLSTISAYVQQEDLFIGMLTVKEHLKFQAALRMEKGTREEEKMLRVEEVMNSLNLKKCENTLIGIPAINVKGISGGERRRLSFATEILTNPCLLFCDEPTSGLDSYMAASVVESMKTLAKQGKTIISTIHQPSSDIFGMFDRLCLLAEGRLVYIGDLSRANDFFITQNMICPSNYNPADYYIQKIAVTPGRREECLENIDKISSAFVASDNMKDLKQEIAEIKQTALKQDINQRLEVNSPYKVGSATQLKWLLWRHVLAIFRNPMITRLQVFQVIFIGLIFGLIFLQQKDTQEAVQNINGVLFLCITNSNFAYLFGVLNAFPPEIPLFLKEHNNGMYRVINYFMSYIISELPRYLLLPIIFGSIVYWMTDLNNAPERYLIFISVIILMTNVAVAFGQFISALASSTNTALGIAGPILTPLMIFGGSFLNNSSIPVYFIWLKYASWLGYAYEILVVNQWDGVESISCTPNKACRYRNGEMVIDSLSMKKENVFRDFMIIVGIYVLCRILAFLFLLRRAYKYK